MPRGALRIQLSGSVQGCGIRPALARLALQNGWSGHVMNTMSGVELILDGNLPSEHDLESLIRNSLPPEVETPSISWTRTSPSQDGGFHIIPSEVTGAVSASIPRDVAICDECLAETCDPNNRRYAYPFTSCSRCGPRYSIALQMPFDRERTTMRQFPLCDDCQVEYHSSSDRRFHAQTICCPACGPRLWATQGHSSDMVWNGDAVLQSAKLLIQGRILALKGVGGYQLLVDATALTSVDELRLRKQRPEKPFAILCRTLDEVRRLATLNPVEAQALTSPQRPIVLLRQLPDTSICPAINPGLREIGVMLPPTALHDRLLELTGRPLVCTSGNLHDEPLIHDRHDAEKRLPGIADLFLHHDRDIQQPIDDSVVRVIANQVAVIRCARGYAPLPLRLETHFPALAVGGHQKSALALSNGRQAWLGPHIADLNSVAAREQWHHRVEQAALLSAASLEVSPLESAVPVVSEIPGCPKIESVALDCHPDYFTTRSCSNWNARRRPVWHHHAHVLAAMLEHNLTQQNVLGVAFDGSGLGPDGTIWGGEFLVASTQGFQRIGHLRQFGLPGGEAAITDIRRLAVALLTQLESLSSDDIADLIRMNPHEVSQLQQLLRLPRTLSTSSVGRLFDGVAALILGIDRASYEGQAATRLESACDLSERGAYAIPVVGDSCWELDWRPMLREIVHDLRTKIPAPTMATRFHRGLGRAIIEICGRCQELPVVLCGGVFQNRVLVELIADSWPGDQRLLGLPGLIPVNDGGLAAGQLVSAADWG